MLQVPSPLSMDLRMPRARPALPQKAGNRLRYLCMALTLVGTQTCVAAEFPDNAALVALYPSLDALYQDLHRNPELS